MNQHPATVVIAVGSNLGDRGYHLRRALHAIGDVVRVVRVSPIYESPAVDAPEGSPPFLNLVLIGTTFVSPTPLMSEILTIEKRLGRTRSGVRNEPRIIDIDLILYGTIRMRTRALTLPHPRAYERDFVMKPLLECGETGEMLARQIQSPLPTAASPRWGIRTNLCSARRTGYRHADTVVEGVEVE